MHTLSLAAIPDERQPANGRQSPANVPPRQRNGRRPLTRSVDLSRKRGSVQRAPVEPNRIYLALITAEHLQIAGSLGGLRHLVKALTRVGEQATRTVLTTTQCAPDAPCVLALHLSSAPPSNEAIHGGRIEIELAPDQSTVRVSADRAGFAHLANKLEVVCATREHEHLYSTAWAGRDLCVGSAQNGRPVHQLTIELLEDHNSAPLRSMGDDTET